MPASGGLEESTESLCAIIKALPRSGAGACEQAHPESNAPASTASTTDVPTSSNGNSESSSSAQSSAVVVEMSRFVAAAVKWAQK